MQNCICLVVRLSLFEPILLIHVDDTVVTSGVASVSVEASSQSSPTLVVCDSQNVTFPNHFTVSAFTNGFIFGSFGSISSDNVEPTAQPSQESDGRIKQSSPSR